MYGVPFHALFDVHKFKAPSLGSLNPSDVAVWQLTFRFVP